MEEMIDTHQSKLVGKIKSISLSITYFINWLKEKGIMVLFEQQKPSIEWNIALQILFVRGLVMRKFAATGCKYRIKYFLKGANY